MQAWMSDPEFRPGLQTLADFSESESVPTLAELEEIVGYMRRYQSAIGQKKIAIVTTRPVSFGVARQFGALAPGEFLTVQVFKDRDAALAWLADGSGATSPRQMKIDSRTVACTAAAMVAFAGNSVLTRLALGRATIDAATFSTVRIAGGAGMLLATTALRESGSVRLKGSWLSAAVLFLYAIPFSFAYSSLTAGTGALILFGVVQVTMMVAAVRTGERPHRLQWVGLALASCGLIYLVLPGLKAPSLSGSLLMALAGIMWGIYSLRGRGSADPLQLNMSNFVRALPLAIVVSLLARSHAFATSNGLLLALVSGAITSGLGYVLWYTALRHLTATRAAIVQLMVPILAAGGGVVVSRRDHFVPSRAVRSGCPGRHRAGADRRSQIWVDFSAMIRRALLVVLGLLCCRRRRLDDVAWQRTASAGREHDDCRACVSTGPST